VIESLEPLRVRPTHDVSGFDVRQDGVEVGRLERIGPATGVAMRASAADGVWLFGVRRERRSWIGVAEAQPSGVAVAGYYPFWNPGGKIVLTDAWYVLRGSLLSSKWSLRDEDRTRIARLNAQGGKRPKRVAAITQSIDITPLPACLGIPDLSLPMLFAVWAIFSEPAYVHVAGG
jgi:hypothetical protein